MLPNAGTHPASANGHPECYGSMFPSVLTLGEDRLSSGSVFSVKLERAGGMWRSSRSVTADLEHWDGCLECENFENCYKLSMATLALEAAVQNR